MNRFVRRCLKEQGYILQDDSNAEWNKLYDQGQFLLRDRYRDHTNRIVDEFKFIGDQFDKDPQNKAFAESMNKLFNDLGHDENGKEDQKPNAFDKIQADENDEGKTGLLRERPLHSHSSHRVL